MSSTLPPPCKCVPCRLGEEGGMEWRAKQEVGGKMQKWPGWRAGWVDFTLDSPFLRMSWPWVDIFCLCNITAKAINVTLEILQDQSLGDNSFNVPKEVLLRDIYS